MEKIQKIVEAYGIRPFKVEQVSNRLFWINDSRHEYALKKSKLTKKDLQAWEYVFDLAYSQGLTGILPVYLTTQSSFYQFHEKSYYYLTPWIPPNSINEQEAIKNLYLTIGEIHAKTKRTQVMETEAALNRFKAYQKACADLRDQSLYYVELFEKNRFMSPFELLACTQFRLLDQVLFVINKHIDEFIESLTEKEWNYSLCHGNLNLSHLTHHHSTHIINWENATFENAVKDLSIFIKQETRYYDKRSEHLTDHFQLYMKKNPLTTSELHLLAIYLLDPFPYIRLVQRYLNHPSNDTMINQTKALQHTSRQLMAGLKWSEYVKEHTSSNEDSEDD